MSPSRQGDVLLGVLEWGLVALVVLAPLPFGSVLPDALVLVEIGAFVLVAVWLVRALRGAPVTLPPRTVLVGLIGLCGLGLIQAVPIGSGVVELISPRSVEVRTAALPPPDAADAERRLLGEEPAAFDRAVTLSVDPGATASALRTGAALGGVLLVASTVAAARGVRLLAAALLVSAAFQGLYGVLVLASGHDMLWHLPKRHYVESATGTFVNRNHFAAYLNGALCLGLALVLRRSSGGGRARQRWMLSLFGPEGSRTLLLGLMVVLGMSGLLLSFSRAGIAIGLAALSITVLASTRRSLRARLILIALVVATAAIPLSQIGSDRLVERYASTATDFAAPGGRATVWADTLSMAADFPVVGSGLGTFATAYPLFRSPEVRLFYRHAHNDPIQFVAEGGVVGAVLLMLVLSAPLARLPRALSGAEGALVVGLAAGLMALVVHSLVDFPFHIPANAVLAAALGGALVGLPWREQSSS